MEKKLEIKKKDASCPPNQFENTQPHRLLSLMYQLELSALSLLRTSVSKNSSKPIFQNSLDGQFNNIVLHFNEENFCIKVQYVDTYYSQKSLDYNSLFSSIEGKFNIRKYLNEFAAELIKKSDSISSASAPKYLIIFTNGDLDITKSGKFKQTENISKQPKFNEVNPKTDKNLIQFFRSRGKFYRFDDSKETRKILENLVAFNRQIRSKMKKKGFSPEEVRRAFFKRLIFAVNQGTIEEIGDTVRREMKKSDNSRDEVLDQLIKNGEYVKLKDCEYLRSMVYSFNLFVFYAHSMFQNKNIDSIRFEERVQSHNIVIEVNNKILQINALEIDLNRLSLQEVKKRDIFSIDAHFDSFLHQVDKNTDFYVIYTNVDIAFLRELITGNNLVSHDSTDSQKFTKINIADKKYSILSHLNSKNLYQFSSGEERGKNAQFLQKSEDIELKKIFLNKLVFATNQQSCKKLRKTLDQDIKYKLHKPKVPYDYGKLYKIGLFYLQSHENDKLTKELMIKISDDLEKKQSIGTEGEKLNTVLKDIQKMKMEKSGESSKKEEDKKKSTLDKNRETILMEESVINSNDLPKDITFQVSKLHHKKEISFVKFFHFHEKSLEFAGLIYFLINEEGKKYVKVFQRNGISLDNLAPVFQGITSPIKIIKSFKELYNLWFNESGKMNECLKILYRAKVKLSEILPILYGSGINAVKAFENLHQLWFDATGNKTHYLINFEKNQINPGKISSVFRESGFNAAENIKEFHDIFFDSIGEKTECFDILEKEKVNFQELFKVLKATGNETTEIFQDLYKLWFDSQGNKSAILMNLEKNKIDLPLMLDLLTKTGKNAPTVFRRIYYSSIL